MRIVFVLHCHYNVIEARKKYMPIIQVRVNDDLKNQATAVYKELGIDLSAAIRMFLKRSIAEGGFPFSTKIDENTLKAIIAIDNIRTTSEKNGNSSMTLEEINEEIRKTREERKTKRKNS